MARAAGDGRTYAIGVVDTKGNLVEQLDGFPSVTTIIGDSTDKSGPLMGWAYNVGMAGVADLLKAGKIKPGDSEATIKARLKAAKRTPWHSTKGAQDRGTSVHEYAEQLLRGTCTYDDVLEGTSVENKGYARALIAWHEQYDRTPVALERVCVSLRHEYAGTVDLIDEAEPGSGVHRVADFKTSKGVYDSQFVQGDAYALAWREMQERRGTPVVVDEVSVIRFGIDGTYEEATRAATDGAVFIAMRDLYRARERAA